MSAPLTRLGVLEGATHRPAATAGCEGVCSAALAVGAFLRGVRGDFRLRLRRRRDFHSSTVAKSSRGGLLAYDARLGMWGDRHAAHPSPGILSQTAFSVSLRHNRRNDNDSVRVQQRQNAPRHHARGTALLY